MISATKNAGENATTGNEPPGQFHLRSKKRKALAVVSILMAIVSVVGYELASLQFGIEKPSQEAIAAAAAEPPRPTPPAIDSYEQFDVAVEDELSVTVHLREDPSATDNIFLVHGAGGGAWVWEEYFNLIPDSYNLYAISWRGHFTSSPVDDADAGDYVADQVAATTAISNRNDLPLHIIGHSYGGATSVLATAEQPDLVASLHVLAPVVPLDYSPVQATLVPLIMPPLLTNSADTVEEAIVNETGSTGTYVDMFVDQEQMDRYWNAYAGKRFSIEKPSLIGGDGISPDWQDELDHAYRLVGESDVPVWFITARYDNVVVTSEQQETADEIGASLTQLESGHYIPLDSEADESVDLILDHLAA